MLVRATQIALPGQWMLSGLLVSGVATLAAMSLLLRLARLEIGRAGSLAPLMLLVFPTAFYLSAPYAESLFLALAIGTLLAARSGYWWAAALLAALASFTKTHAPALVVPLAVLSLGDYRRRGKLNPAALAALAAPLLGQVALEIFSRFWLDDLGPLAQQTARWGWQFVFPGWAIVQAVEQLLSHGPKHLSEFFDLPLVLAGLLWLSWGWKHLPPYLAWYALAVLLPGLSRLMYPPLAANPRFLLLAFPIAIAMALWADRPWRRAGLLAASLVLQMALLVAFVHWTWVA